MRTFKRQQRVGLALAAGLAFLLLPGFHASAQQQSQAVSEIAGQLRQGNNEQALLLASKALALHPEDCKLLSLQALSFTALNQSDAALRAFKHALGKCPAYLPALEGAAQIEVARKSPEAMPLLTRIIAIQPENPVAQGMLASTLQSQGDCAGALPHFAVSRPLFKANPGLLQGYGSCLAQTGDLAGALQQYSSLAATHPGDAYQYDMALLQWKAHDAKGALATLEPLIEARQFEPAFALGSRIAEGLGDTPRAVDLLRTAILLSPGEVESYLDFANLAFGHSSFQVGIDMLNAGLNALPSAAQLYVARGVLEMQLSRQDEAVADFEKAHQLDPKLSISDDALGIVQTQQHQSENSLNTFREQAKLHPNDSLMQYLLAEQLSEVSAASPANLQAAIAVAKRATELDARYQPAHDLLAKLYLRAQQPKLAIEQAELALALDPSDQDALYQELMARRRSGDTNLEPLVTRLNEIRKENLQKQQAVDRYRLVEGPAD